MPTRPIILDPNILIRCVLGEKVPALLAAHASTIDFLAPDTAFEEARKHLPTILLARGDDGTSVVAALDELNAVTFSIWSPEAAYDPPTWALTAPAASSDWSNTVRRAPTTTSTSALQGQSRWRAAHPGC